MKMQVCCQTVWFGWSVCVFFLFVFFFLVVAFDFLFFYYYFFFFLVLSFNGGKLIKKTETLTLLYPYFKTVTLKAILRAEIFL